MTFVLRKATASSLEVVTKPALNRPTRPQVRDKGKNTSASGEPNAGDIRRAQEGHGSPSKFQYRATGISPVRKPPLCSGIQTPDQVRLCKIAVRGSRALAISSKCATG